MRHTEMGAVAPKTSVYQLTEITSATELGPGTYAIQRGDEWLHIELRQCVTVYELADILERINSVRTLRVA